MHDRLPMRPSCSTPSTELDWVEFDSERETKLAGSGRAGTGQEEWQWQAAGERPYPAGGHAHAPQGLPWA